MSDLAKEAQVYMDLGREIVRMIRDVRSVVDKAGVAGGVSYSRRKLTFPGGAVEVVILSDSSLGDLFERACAERMDVEDSTPRSEVN